MATYELLIQGKNVQPFAPADADELSVQAQGTKLDIVAKPGAEADVVVRLKDVERSQAEVQITLNVGENAKVKAVVLQEVEAHKMLITKTLITLDRNASVDIATINIQPEHTHNELTVDLRGEGASAKVNGLYIVGGGQRVDNVTNINHHVPHCTSEELYKGIIDKGGVGAFDGKIYVAEGASKTQAVQTNRNMLLDVDAHAYSNPQLEIYNDDVKCSHGLTSGQIDEAQLFYMQARGIEREAAQRLLIGAFAAEIADRISLKSIADEVRSRILSEDLTDVDNL